MTRCAAVALVVVWSSGFIGAELGARVRRAGDGAGVAVPGHRRRPAPVVCCGRSPALTGGSGLRQAVLALLCQCLYLAGVFWAAAAGVPAGTSALVASLQPALVLMAGRPAGLPAPCG